MDMIFPAGSALTAIDPSIIDGWFSRANKRAQAMMGVFDPEGFVAEAVERTIRKDAARDFIEPNPERPVLERPVFNGPSFKEEAAQFAAKIKRLNP